MVLGRCIDVFRLWGFAVDQVKDISWRDYDLGTVIAGSCASCFVLGNNDYHFEQG